MLLTAAGCNGKRTISDSTMDSYDVEPTTEVVYEEVNIFYGESATYGNMTLTVDKVENPEITLASNGKMILFFHVTIDNGSEETVTTNFLNNFALTVDGTFYESDKCFTIPAGSELYKFYGEETFAEEIPAGESHTGYLAAEVDPDYDQIQFHYIPKTTDRGSRITVTLSKDDVTAAEQS